MLDSDWPSGQYGTINEPIGSDCGRVRECHDGCIITVLLLCYDRVITALLQRRADRMKDSCSLAAFKRKQLSFILVHLILPLASGFLPLSRTHTGVFFFFSCPESRAVFIPELSSPPLLPPQQLFLCLHSPSFFPPLTLQELIFLRPLPPRYQLSLLVSSQPVSFFPPIYRLINDQ